MKKVNKLIKICFENHHKIEFGKNKGIEDFMNSKKWNLRNMKIKEIILKDIFKYTINMIEAHQ